MLQSVATNAITKMHAEFDAAYQHFERLGFEDDLGFVASEATGSAEAAAFNTFCQNSESNSFIAEEFHAVAVAGEGDE